MEEREEGVGRGAVDDEGVEFRKVRIGGCLPQDVVPVQGELEEAETGGVAKEWSVTLESL